MRITNDGNEWDGFIRQTNYIPETGMVCKNSYYPPVDLFSYQTPIIKKELPLSDIDAKEQKLQNAGWITKLKDWFIL